MAQQRVQNKGFWVAIGVAVLAVVVILAIGGHRAAHQKAQAQSKTHGQAVSAVPTTPSSTPSQTVTSTPAPASTPIAKPVDSKLMDEMQTFIEAYYFITPGDTSASREARAPSFIRGPLDWSISMDPQMDKVRLAQGLTIRGQLLPSTVQGYPDPQDPSKCDVSGQVLVALYTAAGTLYGQPSDAYAETKVASVWQKAKNAQWYLLRFVEGGDSG